MMNKKLLGRISKWRKIAKQQKDCFVKFALEYFCFNALLRLAYFKNNKPVTDSNLIRKLKDDKKCKKYLIANKKSDMEDFIIEMKKKPLHNLTRDSYIKIEDIDDWKNFVGSTYMIRNNLFHGYKTPEDERDQKLVQIGYRLLSGFNDYLLNKINNN